MVFRLKAINYFKEGKNVSGNKIFSIRMSINPTKADHCNYWANTTSTKIKVSRKYRWLLHLSDGMDKLTQRTLQYCTMVTLRSSHPSLWNRHKLAEKKYRSVNKNMAVLKKAEKSNLLINQTCGSMSRNRLIESKFPVAWLLKPIVQQIHLKLE